ncbi:MAG: amidohydrolase [Bacteroidetes bacterium]|nr:amidohydrolase [Bacteroidota bacterium]
MKKKLLTLSLPLIFLFYSCNLMKTKADLILYNAKIYTVDSVITVAEAMAVKNGKVLATGSTKYILEKFGSETLLDAGGKPVYPGFIDAHCHFYGYALNFRSVALNGCCSFEEVLDRLKKSGEYKRDEWIVGRGWDHNRWKEKVFPDRTKLDKLYPENPVVLTRIDGHVVLANNKALQKAGIDIHHSFTPAEVEIKQGTLTGILSENAADHMRNAIPKPDPAGLLKLLARARENCFATGLTTVSDAGLDAATVGLLAELSSGQDSSQMIRIYAMLDPSVENIRKYIRNGPYKTSRIHISSVKIYADGSLGSRTALLKQAYSDMPCQHGIQVISADSLREICKLCLEYGYQVNTHAIGDSANKLVLDIYSEYLKKQNDLRWRIEHCQVVDPADLSMFKDYSVIPSIQATHATSDMDWAEGRLGPVRIKWAYAYKCLLKQNGWLANGTDFPIENISPILTFYAAVVRKDLNGKPETGFQQENSLSREEALRSITIWAAMADFWENEIGSLETGKNADFVILDHDIMQVDCQVIPKTLVLETFVDGHSMYKR